MDRQDMTFRVFISSTFSDLVAERNALQEKVFPELRKYCQERNARFQAIDLRWGVGEEAALNQQTINICISELRRCQELSPRPNFILLLGDRYGWRPLPPQVEATEFETRLARIAGTEGDIRTDKGRVLRWYRRDDNAVPAEYVLVPRTGEFADHQRWTVEEAALRAILVRAVVEQVVPADHALLADGVRRKWFDSATHQEARHGALEADDPQDHVFCYFRHIEDMPTDASAGMFRDIRPDGTVDTEAQGRLEGLKGELAGLLPADHVHRFTALWQNGRPELDKGALNDLCKTVERDLKTVIDREVTVFRRREDLDRERESHREFAVDRCRDFVGRAGILQRINDYLASNENQPLILHGRSGSGKTAVMARAWLSLPEERPAVARFIGSTPGSCDLRTLLSSLCRQIGVGEVPSEMSDLVRLFCDRLSPASQGEKDKGRRPVALFLDGLDQLNPTDSARMLYWLPRKLAPGVKLVLSVMETDRPVNGPRPSDHCECFDWASRIWPDRLVPLGELDLASGEMLLDKLLSGPGSATRSSSSSASPMTTRTRRKARRTLQPLQRQHVLEKFRACPLPLYLKLAAEEARHWPSWAGVPTLGGKVGLSDSVDGVLDDLFTRLAEPQNHGLVLVGRALGYIAAGKNGLTEDELLDVLSDDRDVMEWFHSQSLTEKAKAPADRVQSLPVVIWLRLFADIEPYMARRPADGTTVMDFHHRQVGQVVMRRYLAGEGRVRAHQQLAGYFQGLDYWAEPPEAQRDRARRLPPTPRPANVRKVVELPYHRLEVARLNGRNDPHSPCWDVVADLLLDWRFLEAKTEADPSFREREPVAPSVLRGTPGAPAPSTAPSPLGQPPPLRGEGQTLVFELAKDFRDVLGAMPANHAKRCLLDLIEEAIRRDIHFLARHPGALFQCLWNTCWWDSRTAKSEGVTAMAVQATGDPLRRHQPLMESFLHQWAKDRSATCPRPWARALRPPVAPLGAGFASQFPGHQSLSCLALSPRGHVLCTGGGIHNGDGILRLWDRQRSEHLQCLTGQRPPIVSVAVAGEGDQVYFIDGGHTVYRWMPLQGTTTPVLDGTWTILSSGTPKALAIGGEADGAALRVRDPLRSYDDFSCSLGPPAAIIACSADAEFIVALAADGRLRIRDRRRHSDSEIRLKSASAGTRITVAENGRRFAVVNDHVHVFSETGRVLLETSRTDGAAASSLALSSDGTRLAVGTTAGTVLAYDLNQNGQPAELSFHHSSVACLAFGPDAEELIVGHEDGACIALRWQSIIQVAGSPRTGGLAWCDQLRAFVTADLRGRIRIDPLEGPSIDLPPPDAAPVLHLATASQAPWAATASARQVTVWDLARRRPLARLERLEFLDLAPQAAISSFALSGDGRILAVGFSSSSVGQEPTRPPVCLVAADSGDTLSWFTDARSSITATAIATSGRFVAAGCKDGTMYVWDTTNKRLLQSPGGALPDWQRASKTAIVGVEFTPEGAILLNSDEEGRSRAWDLATGRQVASVEGNVDLRAWGRGFPLASLTVAFQPEFQELSAAVGTARVAACPVMGHALVAVVPQAAAWASLDGGHLQVYVLENGPSGQDCPRDPLQ